MKEQTALMIAEPRRASHPLEAAHRRFGVACSVIYNSPCADGRRRRVES